MIHLKLGGEPPALVNARARQRPIAVSAFNTHGPNTKDFTDTLIEYDAGTDTNRVKRILHQRQKEKCAWCETIADWENMPVEHIRPKARADNLDLSGNVTHKSHDHYWWLTWSWENLIFSCIRCNKTEHKGNKFPIISGTSRATTPTRPLNTTINWILYDVSSESPLLVNPRVEDPLISIVWEVDDITLPVEKWTWTVRGLNDKGTMTVFILGLLGRCDKVKTYLRAALVVWPEIVAHLRQNSIPQNRQQAIDAWQRLVNATVVDSNAPYRAAAWCTLEQLVPAARRTSLGFAHPPRPEVIHP